MSNEALFFKDKPLFGLDIGYGSLKVVQINTTTKKHMITGYGAVTFDPSAITDGVITDHEKIAGPALELFTSQLVGDINTRRAVIALPASRTFNRSVRLPKLKTQELQDAIDLEADQYIPVPSEELYIDFTEVRQIGDETEYLIVAAPKKLVDSYLELAQILGLFVVGFQTSIDASARLFLQAENADVPTVLIDLGSRTSDLTIYDNGLVVTGTVDGGGDDFTRLIAQSLNVTDQEAHVIKTKYGLGVSKKQKEITQGLNPLLTQIVKEIRRMIRYYDERSGSEQKIGQIVTMGGGANMPGLSEYLTGNLRIAARACDPWQNVSFARLQPPNSAEQSMYVTAAGLALTHPKELFS